MSKATLVFGTLGIALLSACGSGGGDTPAPTNTPPATNTTVEENNTSEQTSKFAFIETYKRPLKSFTVDPVALDERAKFVTANLSLALQRLSESQGNAIHFPVDQIAAFNQMALGATGETRNQIKAAYQTPAISDDLFHKTHQQWISRIVSQVSQIGGRRSESWAQMNYKFSTDYLNTLALNYAPALWMADFANAPVDNTLAVSNWVDAQSSDLHGSEMTANISANSRLVSGHSLTASADWSQPVTTKVVAQERFQSESGHVYEVPAVNFQGSFKQVQTSQYQAYLIPVKNWNISTLGLLVLMPNSGEFNTVKNQVDESFWNNLLSSVQESTASVTLPAFSLHADVDNLAPAIATQHDNADFSLVNLSGHLYNTLFTQKGKLTITEQGLDSRAITLAQLTGKTTEPTDSWADGYAPLTSPSLHTPIPADANTPAETTAPDACHDTDPAVINPFIFALVESNSSSVLNIGQYVVPHDTNLQPLVKVSCLP